jgi:uncharacterized RDD family membrane protein YckC
MDGSPADIENVPRGYLSEGHKKKFTTIAGILGALFFFAQFILPFVIMMGAMPMMFFTQNSWMKEAKPKRGAVWDSAVWYEEQTIAFGPSAKGLSSLKRISIDGVEEPKTIPGLFAENPWLLPGGERLWIISSSVVGFYQDGDIILLSDRKILGDVSRPFLYKGGPALIEEKPSGLALMVFVENKWQQELSFRLALQEGPVGVENNLQVLWDQNAFHLFLKFGNTLYYRKGFPEGGTDSRDAWLPVSEARGSWSSMLIDGKPTVFLCQMCKGPSKVLGLRHAQGSWEPFFTYDRIMTCDMGVFPLVEAGRFLILLQSFPGSLRLVEAGGTGVETEIKHGSRFPFPKGFMAMMFVPQGCSMFMPLILAFILSALMRRHRICEHTSGPVMMPFASLTRRAFAQIIDFAFIGWPGIVGGLIFLSSAFDMEDMFLSDVFPGFAMLGFVLFGFLWLIICLFGYSLLEGKWGWTPGKWVVGIRVLGADLKACGFGRALVRNLLKFVDGFFNFMVGIMVVALSENWQRVGDMAARTVVIDVRKNGQPFESEAGLSTQKDQGFIFEK